MDPLSITASLAAILAIAGSAAKLSKTLYKAARKGGPAGLGIGRFILDINTFASIVQLAHNSLHEHCNVRERLQSSLILETMEEGKLLDQLVAQSRSVIDHIKRIRLRLKSIHAKFAFLTRLKWQLMKPEIEAVSLRVESAKTSLHLVVDLVTLEAVMQRVPSTETRQYIKDLERLVRLHLRTIQLLQDRIEGNNVNVSSTAAQSAPNMLINLGQRMTRTSRISRSTRSHSLRESIRAHHVQEPHSQPTLVEEETPPPITRTQSIISGMNLSAVPNATLTSPPIRNTLHVRNSFSSLNSDHSEPTSNVRNEGDFFSVRPIDHVLELSTDGEIESKAGHINGRHVTVIINRQFDANLISQAQVLELGLEIQPSTGDNVLIKLGNHQESGEPSVGTVVFEWSDGPSSIRRPFTVHCYVCTHNIPRIILGRPFEERLAHYWTTQSRA